MDASLLLRILGDPDDAQRAIRTVAAEMAALARKRAKAVVDVTTGKALTDIAGVKAALASIRNKDVFVDLEVRGTDALERFRARMRSLGDDFNETRINIGPLTIGIRTMMAAIGIAIPIVVALVAQLGALVASAGAAVAGLGALTVAAGSLLPPAILLAIGVVRRFQEQSEKAGTAAHSLASAASSLGKTFDAALGRGADRVMRGAAAGLRSMEPVIRSLRGEFTAFGGAVGQSLKTLGDEFSSPRWREFFSTITEAATTATPILTGAFTALSRVLRNIAEAAMPSLLDAFRSMRGAFQGWAEGTSNASQLRDTIEGLVDHTRSWVELGKQLGRVVLGFFKAAAPEGQRLTDSIAKGAKALADWINSAKGTAAIRGFLADMRPILDQLWNLIVQVGEAFIRWSAIVAPVVSTVLSLLSSLVGIVNTVLAAIQKLPGPLQTVLAAFLLFRGPIGVFRTLATVVGTLGAALGRLALGGLGGALGGLAGGAARAAASFGRFLPLLTRLAGPAGLLYAGYRAFDALGNAIGGGGDEAIRSIISYQAVSRVVQGMGETVRNAGLSAADGLRKLAAGAIKSMADFRAVVGSTIGRVGAIFGGLPPLLSQVGAQAGRAFAQGLKRAGNAAVAWSRQIATGAGRALQSLVGKASSAGVGAGGSFTSGLQRAGNAAVGVAQSIAQSAAGALDNAAAQAVAAGAAFGNNFAAGIKSAVGAVAAAASQLAQAARNVLPGSEPKDPRSPLRNLADAGRATVENFVSGVRQNLGKIPAAFRDPTLLAALGQLIDPAKVLAGIARRESKADQLRRQIASGNLSKKETVAAREQLASITEKNKAAKDKLSDALGQVLSDSLAAAAAKVAKLGSLRSEMGSAIQRIFAEGATAFTGGAIKSGDLAGSMISGLPVQTWLENLVAEIDADIGATLAGLSSQLGLSTAALAAAGGPAVAGGRGGDVVNINVPAAPYTGGAGDPRVVVSHIEFAMRKRGKGRR